MSGMGNRKSKVMVVELGCKVTGLGHSSSDVLFG